MTDIQRIPLAEIDAASLTRDRTALDPESLRELRDSILKSGLRMPIEVYALPEQRGAHRYGLLSGFRRLAVFRDLDATWQLPGYAAIPAFLRTPADRAEALTAMVEENAIRADLSPWEQARIAVLARDQQVYLTIEEAIDCLYPTANSMKRSRLRAVARVAEALDGPLANPEALSLRQLLRLSNALRDNFGEAIETTLLTAPRDPVSQWAAILPYLIESERFITTEPEPGPTREPATRGRPRRVLRPRPGLVIRREMTRDGYRLHFTGREATCGMLDRVLDEIERLYAPG